MARLKKSGVEFSNSHSLYPTVTTANASAIAAGHYQGDTGDFGNTLYFGFPIWAHGGAPIAFLENDAVLARVPGIALPRRGKLAGGVITESFPGESARYEKQTVVAPPAANGLATILNPENVGTTTYFDAAGFAGRTVGPGNSGSPLT
jgi:hypothetical protein